MKQYLLPIIISLLLSFSVYPMQYILNMQVNFLPLQFIAYVIILIFLFQYNFNSKFFKYIGFFVIYFVVISLYNIVNPMSIITNAIVLSIFTFVILLVSTEVKKINFRYLDQILLYFFIIFIIYSLALNLEHISKIGWIIRSKGFGSGTLYATLSTIAIIYFTNKYKVKSINLITYLLFIIIPLWSILLTQSRGALLILLLMLVYINSQHIKKIIKLSTFVIILGFIVILFFPDFFQLAFVKRIDPSSYSNLEELTSNRIQTQEMIASWLDSEQAVFKLIFGNGLNELKYLVNHSNYEFPHFDILYILYDGGYYSLLFYVFFIILIIKKNKSNVYMYIYLLSSLHTNMILSPAFIFLVYLLDRNNDRLNEFKMKDNN